MFPPNKLTIQVALLHSSGQKLM